MFSKLKAQQHKSQDTCEFTYDSKALPLWELVANIAAQVPDAEWQKLPTDLARRFDEYQHPVLALYR